MVDGDHPGWDDDLACRLVGSRILVGMTRRSASGEQHEQFFGVIEIADAHKGVAIRLGGTKANDELFWLPPDLRSFQDARPGEYRLRSTGEIILDPDFIANWIVDLKATSHQ